MFKWDGSNVTDLVSTADIYEAEFKKVKYWIIIIDHTIEYCLVKNIKNCLPCIIDELKPIFGLYRLGTHYLFHGAQMKLLIKCSLSEEGHIQEDILLSDLKPNQTSEMFKLQVREIFAFREILGITCSYSSSIIVRTDNQDNKYPISFYEPNMVLDERKIIPFSILENWFDQETVDDTVKRICKIYKFDQIARGVFDLRNKITEIFEKIDKNQISYVSLILNRIIQRLQTSF